MKHDSQPEAYYVHVWIHGIHPMLWRRFLVRSDSTLRRGGSENYLTTYLEDIKTGNTEALDYLIEDLQLWQEWNVA
jgi:hypothetical protein